MKRVNFSMDEIKEKMPNKYAAAIIIASRAKAIRENPADTEEGYRKYKPTVVSLKEFLNDKVKYPEFDLEKINTGK